MFESLSKGFRSARERLAGVATLTEDNIEAALRDVRLSLLEADVELNVTKTFLAKVKEKAIGQLVQTRVKHKGKELRIGPSEQFIKICQDELQELMQADGPALQWEKKPLITGIMMVGLQGSGKTTTSAKLARLLEKQGRKVLLVAADTQRPGAIEQLTILGERLSIPVFSIPGGRPVDICSKGVEHARKLKRDTVIFDTAGRLAIDEPLMQELSEIRGLVKAKNILLVVDAMIGQDAVRIADSFHQRLGVTGVVLTKLDGDARGGAALSVRQVTGAPVRFVGMGEALDKLEEFRPDGMASRILGFGDIVGLMKDFEEVVDEKKAEADAKRMLQGQFTLSDFLEQMQTLQQMGPLQDMMEKLPFFADSMPQGMNLDEREIKRVSAMVQSMTPEERNKVELFAKQPSRVKRVAKGSGRNEKDVVQLLERFGFMRQLMGSIGQQAGMLSRIPGMKQLAMARRLKDAVQTGGLEHNPMMGNLADMLLESAVAAQPPSAASTKTLAAQKNKKKAIRKMKKKARKKARR
jgi:signal recognition particle subunit SRP54